MYIRKYTYIYLYMCIIAEHISALYVVNVYMYMWCMYIVYIHIYHMICIHILAICLVVQTYGTVYVPKKLQEAAPQEPAAAPGPLRGRGLRGSNSYSIQEGTLARAI